MSGYYYTREPGAEGQILTGEGAAPGTGLDILLDRESPPLRAAVEIGSAIADLLCIAAEDKAIHGDIRPAHIKIDDRGLVSVEGYGVTRRQTRAPEGRPDSPAADIYGLGVVLHSMLSKEPLGSLPKDPDAHDDEVVSRVLSMDFHEVEGKRWLEDVRRFLCQILAFVQNDRPLPLDAANVLASVAGQCPGEGVESWAARVSRARPQPSRAPAAAKAPPPPPAPDPEEDLGGPVSVGGGFMAKKPAGGVARQAPAAKGESTAFWSREKIAAMLAEEDDEDEAPPPPPRRQKIDIPKPAAPAAPARPAAAPLRAAPEPVATPRAADPEPEAETVRSAPPKIASGNASPFSGAKIERSTVDDDVDEPKPKSNTMLFVGIGAVVLVLLCGGFLALGGGYMFATSGEEAVAPTPTVPTEVVEPVAPVEEAAPVEPAPVTPAKSGSSGAPKGASSSTPKPTASTPKASTPKPAAPAPAPKPVAPAPTAAPAAPAGGSFTVKFATPGREGRLQCGDGQTADFAGATTLSFTGTTTCLVRMDQGRGAVQITRTASVSCTEDAGKVVCTGG